MIEKPIRKYLKQKDYQKHKILRRIKKRNQRRKEAASKIAERALRKKLKLPAFEGGKDEDELLIGGYVAPELVVTPEGNAFRTTESGLPAVSTGALLEAGIPIRRKSKELKNNQKLLGHDEYLAQQAKVDEKVNKTTPSAELLFNIATIGGLNNLSPTQWMRRAYDTGQLINGDMLLNEYMNKLYFGNNGIASDKYARKHPYRAMVANLIGDMATFGTAAGLRQLGILRRAMLAENKMAQDVVANNWKNITSNTTTRSDYVPITALNAASMTPEQWTAAQDAAVASGNMAEAQRLRDLHFQVSAPNTVTSVNGQPLLLYHGTNNTFNAFDLSKYGKTDAGTFGRGVYTTPVKEYALLYGENTMPLYMKLDNPRDYRNYSIGDLIAEKLAFGDDFATGIGIDGVIGRPSWKGFKGLEEYVSHNPRNIKSSFPITYNDKGVRIPLGERDNFNINDIRYGLIPIGMGLTGYGLYNSITDPVNLSYNKGKDPIHIKPSKRGTFTAAAKKRGMGVLLFANKVLKNPSNYSSAMRKKALFAKNATKFKH